MKSRFHERLHKFFTFSSDTVGRLELFSLYGQPSSLTFLYHKANYIFISLLTSFSHQHYLIVFQAPVKHRKFLRVSSGLQDWFRFFLFIAVDTFFENSLANAHCTLLFMYTLSHNMPFLFQLK